MPWRMSLDPGRLRGARLAVALAAVLAVPAPARAEPRLDRVVLVTRHGVRAPTATPAALEAMTGRPWPIFPAEPGALTASLGWYRANAHPRSLVAEPMQFPPVTCPVLGIWSTGDVALTEAQMKGSEKFVDGPWRYERLEN